MTASEAVANLRGRLGLSREEFAKRVDVNAKMIQRVEAGQQPTTHLLMALARLAIDAGHLALADLFESTRLADMEARVEAVRKTGRVRRIALTDLKHWSTRLQDARWEIEKLLLSPAELRKDVLVEYLRMAMQVMGSVCEEIAIPIAEPKLTLELQGAKRGKKTRKQ